MAQTKEAIVNVSAALTEAKGRFPLCPRKHTFPRLLAPFPPALQGTGIAGAFNLLWHCSVLFLRGVYKPVAVDLGI